VSGPSAPWQNRLGAAWHQHLGRPAWAALALAVALGALQWRVVPGLEAERQQLEARLLQRAGKAPHASPVAPQAARPAPALQLPAGSQRAADTELLVDAALRHGLVLERADYALTAPGAAAATRLQATLPLTGTYGALRRYVAAVLNALPHAALESLTIERADAQATQLQATAHLVLFYRPEPR
jgi:hypothetical protein